MVAVACGLLALGVVAFLISPLLDHQRRWFGGRSDVEDLNKQKDFVYSSIRELNIDHKMGKLSDQDHHQLQSEYMQEASRVLDQLEHASNGKQYTSDRIEQAVLEIRRKRTTVSPVEDATELDEASVLPAEESAEPASRETIQTSENTITCGTCDYENDSDANFCIECGTDLCGGSCSSCGTSNQPDAKFCGGCGEKL
ncbi:uncharacterized protein METZ01_LOCUS291651 [marine metagenome]|uniref:DZANK-type domain-containing protein n=1 Tax=marine metagenome TaxID=408172 RepID=A0A382LTY8_9ZZZZ